MDPAEGQGVWTHYAVKDGLPDLKIECLYEDRDGFLWIGTHDRGVARFDGIDFTTVTREDGLPSDGVYSILQDEEETLWFKTREGVSRYRAGQCEPVPVTSPQPRTFLWGSGQDPAGRLWFTVEDRAGSPPMIGQWEGTILRMIPLSEALEHRGDSADAMGVDDSGRLWVGGSRLYQYDGASWQGVDSPGGVIVALLPRPDGSLWVATTQGLFAYGPKGYQRLTDGFTERSRSVRALADDGDGRVWLATMDGQVLGYAGGAFHRVHEVGGPVQALCRDRVGRLWVGTYGDGLYSYDPRRFCRFTPAQGLPSARVLCLVESADGALWVGTQAGLVGYDERTFAAPAYGAEVSGHAIAALAVDRQDRLWVGTYAGGVYVVADGQWRQVLDGQRPLRCLAADPAGRLWVGWTAWWGPDHPYQGGLAYCQGDQGQVFPGTPAGPNQVQALAVDRTGTLWVGLWNAEAHHGLYRYSEGQLERVDGAACPLSDRVPIQALYADREGRLWIGTSAGLWRYEDQHWTHWGGAEGLPHEIVTAIRQTRDGVLWVGTEGGGVGVYDGQVFQAITLPGEAGYNTIHALHEDRHGSVWLATQAGLVRYTPRREPPTVVLEEVRADRTYALQERLEIGTTGRALQFHFRGHSPVGYAASLVYRYRLHGRDPDWRLTRHSPVPYPVLEPGAYRFEVQAVDPDLNYSAPVTVDLTVTPDPRQQALQELLSGEGESFVGQSPALTRVQQQLEQVAGSDLTALILGETGTGKGLAARTLHRLSRRRAGPFVPVNCGALPEHLVESELFGHERGSFTGAHARKLGKVELAAKGTLFLDEIGDMSREAQIRLLRLLEEGTYERVGGTEWRKAEVRVIAATNRDLGQMVKEGAFREDLFFRLHVFPVRLPPLRERREDIPLLVEYFMDGMAVHLHKPVRGITSEALANLKRYPWPGNVRELQHTVERAVIICRGETIQAKDITLGIRLQEPEPAAESEWVSLAEHERQYLRQVLEKTNGVIKGPQGAAAILGLPPSTVTFRIKKLGLRRPPE